MKNIAVFFGGKTVEHDVSIVTAQQLIQNINKEKYRKLRRKGYVYDSLDDEEIDDINIYSFYIAPDSYNVYFIDGIIIFISFYMLPVFILIQ